MIWYGEELCKLISARKYEGMTKTLRVAATLGSGTNDGTCRIIICHESGGNCTGMNSFHMDRSSVMALRDALSELLDETAAGDPHA